MTYQIKCPDGSCPFMHWCNPEQICIHSLFPLSFEAIIGSFLISIMAGISSLAGLGGGGPMISFLIVLFNYSPKVSTLLVYCLIFGGTLGNVANQASTIVNGKPMINYRYCFVSIPFMFGGSLVGVMINKYFPSAAVVSLIVLTTVTSLRGIYRRFKASYRKQTQQIIKNEQQNKPLLRIQTANVFDNPQNVMIFKRLAILIVVFTGLHLVRGSEKIESLIGVEACSFTYWLLEACIFFAVYVFGRWFVNTIVGSQEKEVMLIKDDAQRSQPLDDGAIRQIVNYSVLAGLYSGFGLGGGLFLVPMYKNLGLDPLQATASTAFNILVTASINTLQAVFIGAIKFDQLLYFVSLTCIGSFVLSKIISTELQKRNRLSYVQLMLVILLGFSVFNIPYGLIMKYIQSDYDSGVIFGFGRLC